MVAGTVYTFIDDLDPVWDRLAVRMLRTRSPTDTLLDIRQRCRSGAAMPFASPDGLVVLALQGLEEGGFEARCLLAVSTSSAGAFKRQEGDMLKLARALGADRLWFRTDRRGWPALLGPEWKRREDTFVRRVP